MAEPVETAKNPPNFVTLVQLRERWLKKKAEEEEERIRKQQQEEREKEEEVQRQRNLEVAKELANSEPVRWNSGTSSHQRENRGRRTPSNVVATAGFAQVVDEGDKDDAGEERRWKVKEAKELSNSEAIRRNSGTSSHSRKNRGRRTPGDVAATVGFAEGNGDDEATKRKAERYRRKKEQRASKKAREKEKVMEEGKQSVLPDAVRKESESIEVRIESQRRENDNVENRIRERRAEIGNGSVMARKPKRKSKMEIRNVEKEGSTLKMEKLGEPSTEEESVGGYETKNGVIDNVEKEISKRGAEIGNGRVPARRRHQRKSKVKMEFRGKIGNVENEGSKGKIEEKVSELSVEEENGGFGTNNGVSDDVEKQVSTRPEIGNGSVPSRKPLRKGKVNVEFRGKIGSVEKEDTKQLSKLSIDEENGGFETKNDVSNGNGSVPSRKPQRKSKVNMDFRRKIGETVEKEESKVEIEEKLGELSIEEENVGLKEKNGVSDRRYSRSHGRLNRSGRQNDEYEERRYGRFHGSRGRRNGGRYRGGYESFRMERNGGFKVGVWVRKEDAGSGIEGTVKSSDVLLKETNN